MKGFDEFRNDASLSEPEIEMPALWVEGGAPKGDDFIFLRSPLRRSARPLPPRAGFPFAAIRL